jgi:hypothetical protein
VEGCPKPLSSIQATRAGRLIVARAHSVSELACLEGTELIHDLLKLINLRGPGWIAKGSLGEGTEPNEESWAPHDCEKARVVWRLGQELKVTGSGARKPETKNSSDARS